MWRKALSSSTLVILMVLLAPPSASPASGDFHWESKARLRGRWGSTHGALVLTEHGVEFRPIKGPILRWPYVQIKSVVLSTPRRLKLTIYENKGWHRPGDREFRMEMSDPVAPGVAQELISRTAKPSINGIPDPKASDFASIPARHRTSSGGTNGELRFREVGIDYVVAGERDSRSWRWSDIQTLANPDPYHFRVGGFLETFDFELKQPMMQELFDRLWDFVYARDFKETPEKGAKRHEMDEEE
jgi:hypothetical protein